MDIIKKFYETVRIKQIFAFLINAHANERDYIPFITDKTFINTSLYNILPASSITFTRFTKNICAAFHNTDKRNKDCDNVIQIAEFSDYMYKFNNKGKTKKEKINLLKRKLPTNESQQNISSKVFKNEEIPTNNIIEATIKKNTGEDKFAPGLKIQLLNDFKRELQEIKDKFPDVQRDLRVNKNRREPYLNELRELQERYKFKYEEKGLDPGSLLNIPELENQL